MMEVWNFNCEENYGILIAALWRLVTCYGMMCHYVFFHCTSSYSYFINAPALLHTPLQSNLKTFFHEMKVFGRWASIWWAMTVRQWACTNTSALNLKHLNVIQPWFISLFTPVVFLLLHDNVSAIKTHIQHLRWKVLLRCIITSQSHTKEPTTTVLLPDATWWQTCSSSSTIVLWPLTFVLLTVDFSVQGLKVILVDSK